MIEHTHRAGRLRRRLLRDRAGGRPVVREPRRLLLWLGAAALLAVDRPGRARRHPRAARRAGGTEPAAVHGVFAQVVFSLLVALAVLTAPRRTADFGDGEITPGAVCASCAGPGGAGLRAGRLGRWSSGTCTTTSAQRLHVLTAFAVVAAVAGSSRRHGRRRPAAGRSAAPPSSWSVFVVLQLALGVEAWMGQYAGPCRPSCKPSRSGPASSARCHVLVGAGVLATSVVAAMQAYRGGRRRRSSRNPSRSRRVTAVVAATSHHVKGTA